MTNPQNDIILSMTLLRSGVQGKSKEFKQAVGTYHARRKVWQIKAINYTILITGISLIGLTIYSVI
jgi:hypothetical protein